VAIVTGAAQGLGLGTARRLSEEGARVVLADVDPSVVKVAADLGAVLMLASPLADYVDGAALTVDGGSSAGRAGVRPTR
jgi:NAD(P)-dependent dehydrogenase (short-subunit alcohol dehydrogenase family)